MSTNEHNSQLRDVDFFTEEDPWQNCIKLNKLYEKRLEKFKDLEKIIDSEQKEKNDQISREAYYDEVLVDYRDIISDEDKNFPALEIANAIINNPNSDERYEHFKSMINPVEEVIKSWEKIRLERYQYGTDVRCGIFFFLENGHFSKEFIRENEQVYKIFVEFFKTEMKDWTPYVVQKLISDLNDRKHRIIDSIFIDNNKQFFMVLWTTLKQDVRGPYKSKKVNDYILKLNIHTYILEKYFSLKISKMFMIRLNDKMEKPEKIKVERMSDEDIRKAMISYHD